MKILKRNFFARPVIAVAEDLIGKILVRKIGKQTKRFFIVETEAYDGPEDLACHASKGRTKRTEVMFGRAGVWYIYLIYGVYNMINIVTGKKDYPSAVLIRGAVDLETGKRINGPGKLSKILEVDRTFTGKSADERMGFWIEEDKQVAKRLLKNATTITTPRIGIDYAGPIWSKKHYRFLCTGEDSNFQALAGATTSR
jgi:DNA-3-methyladenine glycosylase